MRPFWTLLGQRVGVRDLPRNHSQVTHRSGKGAAVLFPLPGRERARVRVESPESLSSPEPPTPPPRPRRSSPLWRPLHNASRPRTCVRSYSLSWGRGRRCPQRRVRGLPRNQPRVMQRSPPGGASPTPPSLAALPALPATPALIALIALRAMPSFPRPAIPGPVSSPTPPKVPYPSDPSRPLNATNPPRPPAPHPPPSNPLPTSYLTSHFSQLTPSPSPRRLKYAEPPPRHPQP